MVNTKLYGPSSAKLVITSHSWNKIKLIFRNWFLVGDASKRSGISVTFDTLGFRVKAPGDLSNEELDEALESLYQRSELQISLSLRQLKSISISTRHFCFASVNESLELTEKAHYNSEQLKNKIRKYFESDDPLSDIAISSKQVNIFVIWTYVRVNPQ